jgi:hypothetical protein
MGHLCVACGVVVACVLSLTAGPAIAPRFPLPLAAASIIMWLRFAGKDGFTLQQVLGTYLCCIPVSQIADRYVEFEAFGLGISVSQGLLLLGVMAMGVWPGMIIGKAKGSPALPESGGRQGWHVALVILGVHMIVLVAMLGAVYGHGYERSLAAFGKAGMFYCLYILLGRTLRSLLWRRLLCAVLVAYYAAPAMGFGGMR